MNKNKMIFSVLSGILVLAIIIITTVGVILISNDYKPENNNTNTTDYTNILAGDMPYYEDKCNSFKIQNSNLAKGQIVFIGDSITDFYILDNHYSNIPLAVYNRGIGTDTINGLLNRLQTSVFELEPSKIVMMIGTNDVLWGLENTLILQRYEQLINSIFEKLPNVDLFCMSIIPQNEQIGFADINITTPKIMSLNNQIQNLAISKGATFVNLFELLADEHNHLITQYSDDGLHLNNAGYSIWTSLMLPYLN